MKLKGLTKLALSGVALAAVAATLGTSTYAWYVSNSTATVSGLNGSTASSDLGSLMVNQLSISTEESVDYIVDTSTNWTNKITIGASLKGQPTNGLTPVTKGNGTGANSTSGWHDVANVGVAKANAYGYFMFGAWSTKDTHADVNVGIKNTTTSTTNSVQKAYNPNGLPTGVDAGDTFTQDSIYALKFDFAVVDLVVGESSGNTTTGIVESTAFTTAYKGETAAQFTDYTKLYSQLEDTGFTHGGNAHTYYKALTAENTTTGDSGITINGGESETSSAFGSGGTIRLNLGANQKKVVLIRYWLDGADTDCFDSCRAQSFELNLKLTAVTPTGA